MRSSLLCYCHIIKITSKNKRKIFKKLTICEFLWNFWSAKLNSHKKKTCCLSVKLNSCKLPSLEVANLDKWQNLSSISVSLTYESYFSIEDITIGYSVFFNSYSLLLLLNHSLYRLYFIRPQDQVVVQTDSFTISVFTLRMIQCLPAILEW